MFDADLVEVHAGVEDALAAGVADVVVGQRHAVDAGVGQADEQCRIEAERESVVVIDEIVRGGALEVHECEVRTLQQRRERTGAARSAAHRQQIPLEAAADVALDHRVSAGPRVVGAPLLADGVVVDVALEVDVAAGVYNPCRRGIEGRGRVGGDVERPGAEVHEAP